MQLQLAPDVEAALTAQAKQRGLTVEDYIHYLVQAGAIPPPRRPAKERVKEWIDSARSLPITAPPLSDEAVSRESMYR